MESQDLKEQVKSGDFKTRLKTLIRLIEMGDEQALYEVWQARLSKDKLVRVGCALLLGRLKHQKVTPMLLSLFETDDEALGAAAAWSLGQTGSKEAVPWLIAAAKSHFACPNAVDALGRIGDPTALPVLFDCLKSDHEDTRCSAARALSFPTWHLSEAQLVCVENCLSGLLSDKSRKVRLCASLALSQTRQRLQGVLGQ